MQDTHGVTVLLRYGYHATVLGRIRYVRYVILVWEIAGIRHRVEYQVL
jgi:hypothetical protein